MRLSRLAEWVPAALLAAAAVGTLLWYVAARKEASVGRAAARSALVARSGASGDRPTAATLERAGARARARYWESVAGLARAVGEPSGTRAVRLARLRAAAERARHGAESGPAGARSKAWSVLALTRLAQAVVDDPARRSSYLGEAVTALRRAVALDAGNAEAKANLEVLLHLSAGSAAPRASGKGNGKPKPGSPGPPSAGMTGGATDSRSPPRY